MDLSIYFTSAFALILFATEVAFASRHPHLSVVQVVKDQHYLVPPRRRFLRQQQRSEIMKQLLTSVKHFGEIIFQRTSNHRPEKPPNRLTPHIAGKPVAAREGAL